MKITSTKFLCIVFGMNRWTKHFTNWSTSLATVIFFWNVFSVLKEFSHTKNHFWDKVTKIFIFLPDLKLCFQSKDIVNCKRVNECETDGNECKLMEKTSVIPICKRFWHGWIECDTDQCDGFKTSIVFLRLLTNLKAVFIFLFYGIFCDRKTTHYNSHIDT